MFGSQESKPPNAQVDVPQKRRWKHERTGGENMWDFCWKSWSFFEGWFTFRKCKGKIWHPKNRVLKEFVFFWIFWRCKVLDMFLIKKTHGWTFCCVCFCCLFAFGLFSDLVRQVGIRYLLWTLNCIKPSWMCGWDQPNDVWRCLGPCHRRPLLGC